MAVHNRAEPPLLPLGRLIEAGRATIGADRDELADAIGYKEEQIKELELARRPMMDIAEAALRYVPVDLAGREVALDAEIERWLGDDPIARVVAKERLLARLLTLRSPERKRRPHRRKPVRQLSPLSGAPLPGEDPHGPMFAPSFLWDHKEWLVPRDGFEPPTRGSSDRCSKNRGLRFMAPPLPVRIQKRTCGCISDIGALKIAA